jgi:hypothetical protein
LVRHSRLGPLVANGLQALKPADRRLIEESIKNRLEDSLDLDAAFLEAHSNENRWDYLLGDCIGERIIGLEPHSAKSDEVSTVIRKKQRALEHLRGHLKPGKKVWRWFWVSAGAVHFPHTDRVNLQLAQHNITFVGKQLLKKHLG